MLAAPDAQHTITVVLGPFHQAHDTAYKEDYNILADRVLEYMRSRFGNGLDEDDLGSRSVPGLVETFHLA